jgi:tetratricopeptide (TPR) repeat protein
VLLLCASLLLASIEETAPYQSGIAQYEQVELEAAIVSFTDALPLASTQKERAKVHAWLGLCHAQLGDAASARAQFQAATTLDPDVTLPARAAPEVAWLFEQVRAAAPRPPAPTPPRDPTPAAAGDATASAAPVGLGLLGVGALSLGAGAVSLAIGLDTMWRQAPNPDLFNDQARALYDAAVAEYVAAGIFTGLGVLAVGAGVAVLLVE